MLYFGKNKLTPELFSDHILNPRSIVAIDVETVSLEDRTVLGFSIATTPHDAFYFHPDDSEVEQVMPLLKDKKIKKVFHNALFDLAVMPEIDRCLHPDTKVLTKDLLWKPIQEIKIGDILIGIDAFPISRVRKLRETIVENTAEVTLPAYLIEMENGASLIASGEHPWLTVKEKTYNHGHRMNQWVFTEDLEVGDYIRNGFDVWESGTSYDSGWLSGILDGEGSVAPSHNNTISVSQLPGLVIDRYIRLLQERGLTPNIQHGQTPKGKEFITVHLYDQRIITRLLGETRPTRLLNKIVLDGKEPCDSNNLIKVLSVTKLLSPRRLINIQTSTHTFVAEGFFTHNSNISDTNIMARLLGHTETKLAILLNDINMHTTPASEMLGRGQTMADLPDVEVAQHCCEDTRGTLALYHEYYPQVDKEYYQVELDVIPILLDMSARGLKIHKDDLAKLETDIQAEVDLYGEMLESVNVMPTSNQQVGMFLAYRKNFLPLTKSRRQLRVDKDALEFLDDPWAVVILKFRENNKLLTTYIRPLKDQDRMYFELGMETLVGRLNSSNRNIQNIPPETRHIFVPDSGTFTTGDYSQEHLRILMYFSGDRNMKRIYEEGDFGGDLHQFTAQKMNITRRVGRNVNYSIVYGGTPSVVSQYTKVRDRKRCQDWIDGWFKTFPDAAEWIKHAQRVGLEEGWSLPTLFGRRIKIPDEYEDGMKNKSVNYPILGSDGEVIKRALLICKKHDLPLAVTVHDSITCLHPDTKVLKADLTWIPISQIQIGDDLVGIDEYGLSTDKRRRRLKHSKVEGKYTKVSEAYGIEFGDGQFIIASPNHQWLQVDKPQKGIDRTYTKWIRTDELQPGMKLKYIAKPWDINTNWEAGYAAGLLDSEGTTGRRCVNFTQNEGVVLDKYCEILEGWGFYLGAGYNYQGKPKAKTISINSMAKYLKLIGSTRPPRMLLRSPSLWEGKVPYDKVEVKLVVKLEPPTELIDIKTSSKTFIAEGLASHNCDGDIEFPIEELEHLAPVHLPFEVKKTLRWE